MQKSRTKDQQLLAEIRQGGKSQETALRQIYLDNRAVIDVLIRRNKGSAEAAKDIMQETMIAFYENVQQGKFKGESAISSYLYSIARFIWLNRLKRQKLEASKLESQPTSNVAPSLPAHIAEGESRQQLLDLFGNLGEGCRKVLMQSIYHGLNMKEIAEQMGYDNEQIARNRKYICLKKLKALIKSRPDLLDFLNQRG